MTPDEKKQLPPRPITPAQLNLLDFITRNEPFEVARQIRRALIFSIAITDDPSAEHCTAWYYLLELEDHLCDIGEKPDELHN